MILSRIEIKDKRAMVDFYALHSFVYSLFPDRGKYLARSDPASSGILYRFERGRTPYVLVQSRIAPFWGESKTFDPTYLEPGRYWFRLRANAAWRRNSDRRRLAHIDPDAQMAWLERKANAAGFVITQAAILDRPGIVRSTRRGLPVVISPVTYEGELQITEVTLFNKAIQAGIGSGKSFGCGLLSLARV